MSAVTIQLPSNERVQLSYYALPHFFHRKIEINRINGEEFFDLAAHAVCTVIGITEKQLKSKIRLALYVRSRMYLYLIARRHTTLTLTDIGSRTGGRDHTTVIHGIQTITDRIRLEEAVAKEWRAICNHLNIPV